jgi:hypothetical protein
MPGDVFLGLLAGVKNPAGNFTVGICDDHSEILMLTFLRVVLAHLRESNSTEPTTAQKFRSFGASTDYKEKATTGSETHLAVA